MKCKYTCGEQTFHLYLNYLDEFRFEISTSHGGRHETFETTLFVSNFLSKRGKDKKQVGDKSYLAEGLFNFPKRLKEEDTITLVV